MERSLRPTTLVLATLLSAGAVASAQTGLSSFGVGATVGLVNSIKHEFRFDKFDTRDYNAWLEYRPSEDVLLRGTLGNLRAPGADPDSRPKDKIDFGTVAAAYPMGEGYYTSSLFGGIGGYRVRPESLRQGDTGRDRRETVFGFHLGVDGDFAVVQRLSIVARLTVHFLQTEDHKTLLTANGGLLYRF